MSGPRFQYSEEDGLSVILTNVSNGRPEVFYFDGKPSHYLGQCDEHSQREVPAVRIGGDVNVPVDSGTPAHLGRAPSFSDPLTDPVVSHASSPSSVARGNKGAVIGEPRPNVEAAPTSGNGLPRDVRLKAVMVRMPPGLHAAFKAKADSEGRPLAQAMRQAVKQYVEEQ